MADAQKLSRRRFFEVMAAAGGGVLAAGLVRPGIARAAKPGGKPVKIGHQAVLSGVLGGYGQFMKMGAQLAADEINAAGGILGRPLEFQFRDSKVKPAVAVKNARYFVDEWGADFLAGIDSSGVALAVGKVMPQLNKLLMVTHAATEKVNELLVYKQGIKQIFRISVPVYQDGIASAMIAKDLDVKRWATISPKYEYGYTSWRMFKDTLRKFRTDVEFVEESWAPFGTKDFGPHISKVTAAKPEGIFTTEWGGEAVALVKQAKLYGVFGRIKEWVNPMGAAMDVLEGLGKDYPEGLWVSCRYWFLYPPTGINESFVERFHKRWGHHPHYSSETSYSAYWALKKACELAGSTDLDKVIEALEGMTMISPAGRRWFRKEDHQAVYEVPWGRTKADPKYPFRILRDLRVVPAEMYYRRPPFTA
ncbi:MAG: ABC transporter substrate-binding protein [Nitrospinota bacterium]